MKWHINNRKLQEVVLLLIADAPSASPEAHGGDWKWSGAEQK